jgi:SAM-dependent methyltransferase
MNDEILERERAYHNACLVDEFRTAQDKFYYAIRHCDVRHLELLFERAKDATVLDYGCATGEFAVRIAPVAKAVYGIDISDVAIEIARERAAKMGLANTQFLTMDAQATAFPDGMFDLVCGAGILHHLDTRRALTEIARVLKPGGVAIIREPLGENLLINLYRAATPKARTVDEHPFTRRDFAIANEVFPANRWEFFGLATLASVPFQRTALGEPIHRLAASMDAALLRTPGLRWQAWVALMTFSK